MARQIDERIVQMTFDNRNFEKNAKSTIGVLDKLKSSLNFSGATKGLDDLNTSASKVNLSGLYEATLKVSDGFNMMEQIVIGALRRIGDRIVDTGIKLTKSLSIDNLASGWNKYTEQTQSVQTLVNSTGKSVEEIDKYLEKLMWYSDETSFGFTDMTKALATMVSSGGDINNLVPMIYGIGNATAFAGKGAAEFQRVIYNLNQSYSQGFLNTMDWKSIELAGVDSKALKEQLIGAAEALGKIDKGIYGIKDFRDLLSDKVFTREVMEQAFGSFAELSLEAQRLVEAGEYDTAAQAIAALSGKYSQLAEDSFKAAQEAKSFTEAIEATKDAVSSGWMQSFKLIFGNYTESKALWTDLTETFWEIFASGAEKRNDILSSWKDIWTRVQKAQTFENVDGMLVPRGKDRDMEYLTQTQALLAAVSEAIINLRDKAKDAWNKVFPIEVDSSARTLFNTIESIRGAVNSFNNGIETNTIVSTLENALSTFLITVKAISNVGKEIQNSFINPLATKLKPVIEDLLQIINNLFDIWTGKMEKVSEDTSPLANVFKSILDILDPIINVLSAIVKWFRELTDSMRAKELDDTVEKFGLFKNIGSAIARILEGLAKIFKGTSTIFKDLGSSLSTVFDNLQGSISNFLSSNGTDVANIAEAGFLGYIILGLTQFTKKLKGLSLETVMDKVKGSFKSLGFIDTIKETFNTLTESIKTFTESIKVKMLDQISTALIKLAAAVLIISLIDSNKLVSSLGAIAGLLVEVITAMALVNSIDGKGLSSSTKAFSKIASGLLVLSVALKILSTIDPNQMLVALSGMGAVLLGLGLFLAAVNKSTKNMKGSDVKSLGSFMKSIGKAMIEMSIALKIMATINIGDMGVAILGLVGVLASIGLFIIAVDKLTSGMDSKKMTILGSFMKSVGFAMIELAASLKILSTIKIDELGPALLGLVGLLSIISIFILAMNKIGGGGLSLAGSAAGLILMSAALLALSGVLKILSAIGWDVIGDGLLKMSAVMLSFGVIGAILGVISPLFLLFSTSLLTFGLALKVIVSALTEAIPLFIFFQAAGEDFVTTLIGIFTKTFSNLLMLLPQFIVQLISTIISTLSQIKDLIIQVLDLIIAIIIEGLPKLIELGTSIIIALLTGIKDNIYQVTTIVMDIITQFLSAMTEKLPELINGLLQFLTAAINGVAEGIRGNAGEIGAAVGNLMSALLEGLVDFAWSAVSTFGKNIWDAITSPFTGKEKEAKDSGKNVMDDVKQGMEEKEPELKQKAEEIGTTTAESMEDTERATQSGQNMISGLLSGLSDTSALYEKGKQAARAYMDGFDSEGVIRSPSKEMIKRGKYMIDGLVIGLKQMSELEQVSKGAGSMILDAISNAIQLADKILDDGMNPVITPVLDLSNIEENAGGISNLLSAEASLYSAQNINSLLSSLDRRNNRLVKEDQFGIQNGGENGVTFVQNNYSPKSLSSIEIYRQTKNQISVMKGLVNSR